MRSKRRVFSRGFNSVVILLAAVCAVAQGQGPDSAEQYLKRGITRYRGGDLDGAVADFTRAI